ncbi:MAG: hypothetical protein JJE25_10950 [Bacteroidia bacterium]|nr:hypothetical protein [Bacteroidia bacterium]
MKKLVYLCIFISSFVSCKGQDMKGEIVEWDSPAIFSVQKFYFENTEVKFECQECKYLEIKSSSGVSGFFILGKGTYILKKRNITDVVSGCMIRLNPADINTFISITSKENIKDAGFLSLSRKILNDVFRHCYHAGMNALIPDKGIYALNFFGEKYGDVLITLEKNKLLIYSFTEKREL